jgi:predicted GH43/DUF377 family glycosyl hydrolase
LFILLAFLAAASTLSARDELRQGSVRARTNLPNSFQWSSSGPIISPKDDSHKVAGIKDPSIVEVSGVYHVFVSTAKASGYNLVYFSFTDFSQAN